VLETGAGALGLILLEFGDDLGARFAVQVVALLFAARDAQGDGRLPTPVGTLANRAFAGGATIGRSGRVPGPCHATCSCSTSSSTGSWGLMRIDIAPGRLHLP
jgi:hypothetical protein